MATWQDFEKAAPELARLGRECFDRTGVAMLGTLRRDGSPRISPIEPYFARDELLFGAMTWSAKARDLARDARCVLHSAVTDAGGPDGELKLYGRAIAVREAGLRDAPREAWWVGRATDLASVFSLGIEQAAFVRWDTAAGLVLLRRWSPGRGYSEVERAYP